jgi:hypothetical protein
MLTTLIWRSISTIRSAWCRTKLARPVPLAASARRYLREPKFTVGDEAMHVKCGLFDRHESD